MTNVKPSRRVAVIGTGVIGASWTALFLANGLQVVATDPAQNAEASLRTFVETAWPARQRLDSKFRRTRESTVQVETVRRDGSELLCRECRECESERTLARVR